MCYQRGPHCLFMSRTGVLLPLYSKYTFSLWFPREVYYFFQFIHWSCRPFYILWTVKCIQNASCQWRPFILTCTKGTFFKLYPRCSGYSIYKNCTLGQSAHEREVKKIIKKKYIYIYELLQYLQFSQTWTWIGSDKFGEWLEILRHIYVNNLLIGQQTNCWW